MTNEPGATDAAHLRLPASVDTLEALRLGKRLQDAAARSRRIVVDASAVEEIGLAGLQLLALVKTALARDGGSLTITDPSPALSGRIVDGGMGQLLLDAPAEGHDRAQPRHSLIFTDAALDYGREPVDALRRLHEAGIGVEPVLPLAPPPIGAIEADHLLLRFDLHLSGDAAAASLADALAEFGGDALIDAPDQKGEPAPVPQEQSGAGPSDTQAIKFERLMADIEVLMMRHGALAARAASLDRDLAAELKAMGDTLRSLQDHAIAAGLAPLRSLLRRHASKDAVAPDAFPGGDIEVEPAVIEPLLPSLSSLLSRVGANGLSAEEVKGLLVIEVASPAMPPGLAEAVATVRGRATVMAKEAGSVLRLELPRSRAMLEALIVGAGAQIGALPVDRAIEILRPDPADLASVGSGSQLLRFRGTYLPLVDLAAALGQDAASPGNEATIVVVVQSGAGNFGIRVREVTDHRQIMVKPLDGSVPAAAGVVGLSFSAGGIALVLDVDALRLATLSAAGSS